MNAFKLWFFSLSIWTKQETHQTQSEGLDPPLAICKKGKGEDKDRKCVYRSLFSHLPSNKLLLIILFTIYQEELAQLNMLQYKVCWKFC